MSDELTGCADDQIYGKFTANEVRMAAENTRLRTQLATKDKALRRIEFLILDDGLTKRDPYDQRWLEPRCLTCGRTAEEKHLADCEIGQALSPNTTEEQRG